MSPLLVIVFLFFEICTAPSIVFPDEDNDNVPLNISEKLKQCLIDDFKIEFKGECRALLKPDTNICPEGQWLVLDLPAATLPKPVIQGKCVLKRCPLDQHYWVNLKKCVHSNESSSLCPSGNILDTDYFGDGYCNCIKNPVHIKHANTGVCYAAYTRGPCSRDKVWVVGGCRVDKCAVTRARFPKKIIVPWSDGKCYAVNEQGPCPQGNDISINIYTQTPECVDRLTDLHLIDGPCSGTDHSGQCTRPIIVQQTTFYSQVAEQAIKKPRNVKNN